MHDLGAGSTKRKPLTPMQRLALFERHKGICSLCNLPIQAGDSWIDEHMRALGLGGSNDASNRGIAHVMCAHAKTHGPDGDLAQIARAKRVKAKHVGARKPPSPQLSGRTRADKKAALEARADAKGLRIPKPRSMFTEA